MIKSGRLDGAEGWIVRDYNREIADEIDDSVVEAALQSWFANKMKLEHFHKSWVDQMRAVLLAVAPAIRERDRRDCACIESLVEALLEARPYVPEHHVQIMHKIDSAIAKATS